MPVFYFSGKENYLKKQEIKKISKDVECPELNVVGFHELSPELYDFVYTSPFVGTKKLAILYFFPEQEEFLSVVNDIPESTDIYILTSVLPDQRKKVVKQLMQLVETREFNKIDEQILYKCISSRLQRLGYTEKDVEAVKDVIMECFHGYILYADMDLEVVQKHVQMIAFSGALTPDNIRAFSPDSSDYRAFLLSNMLLSGDNTCIEFAHKLLKQGETAIGLFSLVAYQIRVCYKAVLFSGENFLSRIGIRNYQIYKNFADYDAKTYIKIYKLLMEGIRRIKKGEYAGAVMADSLTAALTFLKEE